MLEVGAALGNREPLRKILLFHFIVLAWYLIVFK